MNRPFLAIDPVPPKTRVGGRYYTVHHAAHSEHLSPSSYIQAVVMTCILWSVC